MSLLAPSTDAGMDVQVPQLAIDGNQSVVSPGLSGLPELSVGKTR